ncbi:MAG TPA: protein-methionine-sulfoxide reductase heme-binding subunit MsrQ [Stellaceae bacterium]|nr:protein-methionine-sulfoxide reductase heme-binding subunit MsrQ [Stellaceae bacterium]
MYPWLDYGGRVSPLKSAVFVFLFLPGLWVALALSQGWLGSRPLTEAIHQIGLWTIRFIFLALTITPARRMLNWPKLIEVRRMIGVAAFFYICIHFTLYTVDEAFAWGTIASEIVRRIYLTIGFTALLGLAALAATSTDGMVRRIGARRWQRLHRIVYGIGVLAIIHFFMQSKANVWEPLWMAGLFLWLMGWRLLDWLAPRGRSVPLWQVALLGLVAAVATGFGEAGYYAVFNHAPFMRVLDANFSSMAGVRPSWVVLGVTSAMTALAAIGTWRRISGRASPARSRASAARGA